MSLVVDRFSLGRQSSTCALSQFNVRKLLPKLHRNCLARAHSRRYGDEHKGRPSEEEGEGKPVFNMAGCVRPATLDDVRDACDACAFARTEQERRNCFEVFGLDANCVDKYLQPVLTLERTWDGSVAQADETGKRMVSFGTVLLCLMLGMRLI